jgi:hypothetical protein
MTYAMKPLSLQVSPRRADVRTQCDPVADRLIATDAVI